MKKDTNYYSFDADTFGCIFYNKETGETFEFDADKNRDDIINQTFILSKTIISTEEAENNELSEATNYINYCKDFRGNGVYLKELLRPQEQVLLRFLADYMCYNDCVLRTQGSALGKELDIVQLSCLYQMETHNFRKLITRLKDKQCIMFHKENTIHDRNGQLILRKCISVNPYIYSRGTGVSQEIISLYKETTWAKLPRSHRKEW